jgi:hypothetical protein
MQTDVESVARGLTKAQQEAVDLFDEYGATVSFDDIQCRVRMNLFRLGILAAHANLTPARAYLTPFGEEVAAHLKGNQNGN